MSFTFSFSGDDIENESESEDHLTDRLKHTTVHDGSNTNPPNLVKPKLHSLEELLEDIPSQITYNYLPIPDQNGNSNSHAADVSEDIKVTRRSLFDIRQQLMAEADPATNNNDSLLSGLEHGDLTSGIYEGGFKTWECALDLASLVKDVDVEQGGQSLHIVELGAGSAVPSLVLLQKVLKARKDQAHSNGVKVWPEVIFTLCDYNEDVLRLGTAVNVFLTTLLSSNPGLSENVSERDDTEAEEEDLDLENIDEKLVKDCMQRLSQMGISLRFISGAWGSEFLDLVQKTNPDVPSLILASETIYSPSSTKVFSDLLINLLKQKNAKAKAWVAAKKVYFGVGGGVQDFSDQLSRLGGSHKTILDVKGSGVGRIVLQVTGP